METFMEQTSLLLAEEPCVFDSSALHVFPQLVSKIKAEFKAPADVISFYASHMQTQMFW